MATKRNLSKIRIYLRSYDYCLIDSFIGQIVKNVKGTGALVSGPLLLPTKIEKFSFNRSPHGDKKAMDQFERRTHSRILEIEIIDPTSTTVEELTKMTLPAGIHIEIKV